MRILVTSSYSYWGDFTPADLVSGNRQVGGGETAMINIAKGLAGLGHEVLVFYDVSRFGRYDGVDYLPTSTYPDLVTSLDCDVLISWDFSLAFKYASRALINVLAFQLNDASIGVFEHAIDLYMHPSDWHAKRFQSMYPEMSSGKVRTLLTNGVDPMRYTQVADRDPFRVLYSSSPDRGLHHLLRMWPQIIERVPAANLHVFYDINRWLELVDSLVAQGYYVNTKERADSIRAMRGAPGVTFHGGIGQKQLAQEQLKSRVVAYPCDPVQPTEGFSMSCLEALCAGCELVTTNADALPEVYGNAPGATLLPLPVDDGVWVETVVNRLTTPLNGSVIRIADQYTWTALAVRWQEEITMCLASKI